ERRAEVGVDISVECITPDGLSGKKRVWFRGIFHLIGILRESPFVSKLRKAESAKHSPTREEHPRGCFATCSGQVGMRRVFRHFSWLEVGSVKVALPRPTPSG